MCLLIKWRQITVRVLQIKKQESEVNYEQDFTQTRKHHLNFTCVNMNTIYKMVDHIEHRGKLEPVQ